jgi:hypothetical protein
MLVFCCHGCDEQNYGKRLSKTEAMQRYKLRPLMWLGPDLVLRDGRLRSLKRACRIVGGGVEATYLLEKEVVELAALVRKRDPKRNAVRRAVRDVGGS